jgi:cytochrome P450
MASHLLQGALDLGKGASIHMKTFHEFNDFSLNDPRALIGRAVSVLIVSVFSLVIYRLYFHPLSRFPGPFLARITGFWRTYQYAQGNWHEDILKIHKKYGRVVRIAPNELAIVDESAMKALYGHGTKALKTKWYSVWDVPDTAPQLFSELDKTNHAFLRKRLSNAYSMSSIMKYETYVQGCLDLLWSRLSRRADGSSTVVNMSHWTNALAFDVIGELGYGEPLGHVKADAADVGNLRGTILGAFTTLSILGHIPGQLFWINNALIDGVLTWLSGPSGFSRFRTWSVERIQKRLDNVDSVQRDDLLSHFCRMKKDNGEPAAFGEVLIEAMNLVYARHPLIYC